MARYDFGGGPSDWTFNIDADGSAVVTGGQTLTMWSARTGGSQYTDLRDESASPITSVTSGTGSPYPLGHIPPFEGPDGITQMWADAGGGQRVRLVANDLGADVATHETRITALEGESVKAVKTADETVTSSNTLQNDDHLTVAVAANKTYAITGFLIWTGNETGDIKFALTFPTGATVHWAVTGGNNADTGFNAGGTRGGTQYFASLNQTSSPTGAIDIAGSTSPLHGHLLGTIVTAGTAGNLRLQWAQNTSNGTGTVLKKGSWLKVEEI